MSQDLLWEAAVSRQASNVVSVRNVYKKYTDNIPVLQNYSMNVEQGQIYGLLGSSGCGKSTVLSCIIGLQKWDSGIITVLGEQVRRGISTQNIGYMPQDYALYNQLTVREMLQFHATLHHISHTKFTERMTLVQILLKLDRYERRRIVTLSGGQKRRISLALTIMHDPKLLILDEPTVGLDPLLREKIWDYFFKLTTDQKTTIIITTHYIEEVKNAHRVGVMRRGTLLAEGDPGIMMNAHNTCLLEDVVLKICKMDSLQSKQATNSTFPVTNRNENEYENRANVISRSIARVQPKSMEEILVKPFQRVRAYNRVIWINFLRQPIFIILLIMLPPFQILTTGFVVGKAPLNNHLGIVNEEVLNGRGNCSHHTIQYNTVRGFTNNSCHLNSLSCSLVNYISTSIYLNTIEFNNQENARLAVERGDIMGYIEIPSNYSSSIIERAAFGMYPETTTIDRTIIKLNFDWSNTIITYTVLQAIYDGFAEFLNELSTVCSMDLRRFDVPVFFRNPVYGSKDVTVQEYMLSALIICIMFEVAFIAAPLVLINDLDMQIFERSRVAGLKLWEMISGIFLAILTITVFQAIVCFLAVEFLLGVHVHGTIWAFILLCVVIAFCNSAFGLLIGIWCNDTVAILLTEIFLFPVLAVHSGFFRVLEVVPRPFRTLLYYVIPNVSAATPLRWIMNRGVGLSHPMVWPGVLVTFGWGIAFTIICAFLLRRM